MLVLLRFAGAPCSPPRLALIAVLSLRGVAMTHLADLPHKLAEARYLAALFMGLITTCTVLALAVITERFGRRALVASGWLAVATMPCGCRQKIR